MTVTKFQKRLKPFVLPLAIVFGFLFYKPIAHLQFLVPYIIFTMLFITFCRVRPSRFRPGRMVWMLLAVQVLGSVAVFFALRPLGLSLAQSAMICVLCPTATAAPVVTGLLGGSIERVASYSIVCNLTMAIFAPMFFVVANPGGEVDFFRASMEIAMNLAPMIVFPLGAALLLGIFAPKAHDAVAKVQGVSFYLWAVSLFLVVGKAVGFVMSEPSSEAPVMIAMAITAALICVVQFAVGRYIGGKCGDKVSAAQGLAQKNTVLGIWMALNYLLPVSSIGPAAYIIWQNLVNSWQLFRKTRAEASGSMN